MHTMQYSGPVASLLNCLADVYRKWKSVSLCGHMWLGKRLYFYVLCFYSTDMLLNRTLDGNKPSYNT